MAKPPEGWQEQTGRIMDALMIEQGEARSHVVSHASRVIDALTGNTPGVRPMPNDLGGEFSSAPSAIPAVGWEGSVPGDGWKPHIVGNVGEFYADVFSNEKPSAVFNAAFYAGVLAVKLGIVDVEDFHHDTEPKQSAENKEQSTES